ncbi:hypothetical protein FOZ63_026714 [Perkinsus olseni]|uniref:Uncharacterized protein n=1 Tax=Perkinsus olseni TaxID=32597 RepID=A0A7J6QAY6_PEROL|nr:hypothetical protein FOZ62_029658 [Perkinsus olseni]KAF4704770.1 hypothetical protein FOZ63_026714 [Perkinsus olseni]
MFASRLWLYSVILSNLACLSYALTSAKNEGQSISNYRAESWRGSRVESEHSYAKPAMANPGPGFPPSGLYKNEVFGVVARIEWPDKCTFIFQAEKDSLFTPPYSSMILHSASPMVSCYIPAENYEIHHLGNRARKMLGLPVRNPLIPTDIKLCHSVQSNKTYMILPIGVVPLVREPLTPTKTEEGDSRLPGARRVQGSGDDRAGHLISPRSTPQSPRGKRRRHEAALERTTILEQPRQWPGGSEVSHPELRYTGYATGNPLDILATAAMLPPTGSYKRGPSRSEGILDQPIPGPSVGIPSRPVHANPAVAPHKAPMDAPYTGTVASSTAREEAGGRAGGSILRRLLEQGAVEGKPEGDPP